MGIAEFPAPAAAAASQLSQDAQDVQLAANRADIDDLQDIKPLSAEDTALDPGEYDLLGGGFDLTLTGHAYTFHNTNLTVSDASKVNLIGANGETFTEYPSGNQVAGPYEIDVPGQRFQVFRISAGEYRVSAPSLGASTANDTPAINHHIADTALIAANGGALATAGEPTLAEIQAYVTATPASWGAVAFYTGDDVDAESGSLSTYNVEDVTGDALMLHNSIGATLSPTTRAIGITAGFDVAAYDGGEEIIYLTNKSDANQFIQPFFDTLEPDETRAYKLNAAGNYEPYLDIPSNDYDHINVNGDLDLTNTERDARKITASNTTGFPVTVTYGTILAPQTAVFQDGETGDFVDNGVSGWKWLDQPVAIEIKRVSGSTTATGNVADVIVFTADVTGDHDVLMCVDDYAAGSLRMKMGTTSGAGNLFDGPNIPAPTKSDRKTVALTAGTTYFISVISGTSDYSKVSLHIGTEEDIDILESLCNLHDPITLSPSAIAAGYSLIGQEFSPPEEACGALAQITATEQNVSGQPAGNGLMKMDFATAFEDNEYVIYDPVAGSITNRLPTGIPFETTFVASYVTAGTGDTSAKSYYFRNLLNGDAVGDSSGASGVFGQGAAQAPATVTIPKDTEFLFDVRSVSSAQNQRVQAGSFLRVDVCGDLQGAFTDYLEYGRNKEPVCDVLDYSQLTDIYPALESSVGSLDQVPGRIQDADVTWNPVSPGDSVTRIVQVITESGVTMPVSIKVTQLNSTGNASQIVTLAPGGRLATSAQNRDIEIEVVVLDDIFGNPYTGRIALHASSLASSESIQFTSVSPVIEFAGGAGSQNISANLPYANNWHNNNNNAQSGFGFAAGNRIVFRKLNTSGAGASLTISLRDLPTDVVAMNPCDVDEILSSRIGVLSHQPEITINEATGLFLVKKYKPDTPINTGGADISVPTGFDLTKPGEFMLWFEAADNGGATRSWGLGMLFLDTLIERYNAGDTVDGRVTFFDNDFIDINISNPETGELLIKESGRDFGIKSISLMQFGEKGLSSSSSDIIYDAQVTAGAGGPYNLLNGMTWADVTDGRYERLELDVTVANLPIGSRTMRIDRIEFPTNGIIDLKLLLENTSTGAFTAELTDLDPANGEFDWNSDYTGTVDLLLVGVKRDQTTSSVATQPSEPEVIDVFNATQSSTATYANIGAINSALAGVSDGDIAIVTHDDGTTSNGIFVNGLANVTQGPGLALEFTINGDQMQVRTAPGSTDEVIDNLVVIAK